MPCPVNSLLQMDILSIKLGTRHRLSANGDHQHLLRSLYRLSHYSQVHDTWLFLQLLDRISYLLISSHAPAATQTLCKALCRIALGGPDYCQQLLAAPALLQAMQSILEAAVPCGDGDSAGIARFNSRGDALRLMCILVESSQSIAKQMRQYGALIQHQSYCWSACWPVRHAGFSKLY